MSQMQVNVYQQDADRLSQIGIGYVADDGSFALVTSDSSKPLILDDGTYHIAIESIGAEVAIPPAYRDKATTPLVVQHSRGASMELRLPRLKGMN